MRINKNSSKHGKAIFTLHRKILAFLIIKDI